MKSFPSLPRLVLLLLLALGLGGVAPVPDAAAPDMVAPATAREPAEPQTGAVGPEELETFVPTERLPADVAVSFPVDI